MGFATRDSCLQTVIEFLTPLSSFWKRSFLCHDELPVRESDFALFFVSASIKSRNEYDFQSAKTRIIAECRQAQSQI